MGKQKVHYKDVARFVFCNFNHIKMRKKERNMRIIGYALADSYVSLALVCSRELQLESRYFLYT